MSRLHGVRPVGRRGRGGEDATDRMLSALGARSSDSDADDPLAQELRAFVASVDEAVAGIDPSLPRTAAAPATLILPVARPAQSPMRRRLMVSAAMSAVLIAAAGGLVVANHKSSPTIKLSSAQATAESTKLLDHAGKLLAAGKAAPAAVQSSNVAAARVDLIATASLLPAVTDDHRREDLGHRLDALSQAAGLPPPPGSPARSAPDTASESEHAPESERGGAGETERESEHPTAVPSGAVPESQRGRPSNTGGPGRGGPPPTARPTAQPTLSSSNGSGSGGGTPGGPGSTSGSGSGGGSGSRGGPGSSGGGGGSGSGHDGSGDG